MLRVGVDKEFGNKEPIVVQQTVTSIFKCIIIKLPAIRYIVSDMCTNKPLLGLRSTTTMGPTYKKFGYFEHPAVACSFFSQKRTLSIDINGKKVWLQ